jgi:DNA-binding transcriptional ArsR family regulator
MVTQKLRPRDAVFRAIADPTRRRILQLLRGGRLSVNEIAGNFRTSRPAVSRHLRQLRSAGLLSMRQEGTSRYCTLSAQPLRAVNDWLCDYQEFWDDSLRGLKKHVEEKR